MHPLGLKDQKLLFLRAKNTQKFNINAAQCKLRTRNMVLSAVFGGFIFLSGCALTPNQESSEQSSAQDKASIVNSEKTDSENKAPKEPVAQHAPNLDAKTMFEILAAEMMVQKNQMGQAFEVLYPLAVKTKDPALAERTFQIAMGTFNVPNIEKATLLWREVAPDSAIAWRASFLLTLRHNKVAQALKEWDTYRKLSKQTLSEELVSTATKVAGSVSKESGTEFFQALTQKYPDEWASYYGLAMISAAYRNPDVGIVALQKAKPLLPKEDLEKSLPVFYHLLSQLYLMDSQPEEGIKALTPYVEKHPDDLLVQERVARLEVQAVRYDDAEKRYLQILKVEPNALTSRLSVALIQIEQNKYEQAEKNLLLITQNKAYESVGYYYLGIMYQESGQIEKAIKAFETVKTDNYLIDSQLHLAEIYFAQKNTKKAFDVLNSIQVKNDKDKVKVLRAKAIFNTAENKTADAIKLYEQALKIEPDNLEILKAESLIFYNLEKFEEYEANLLKVLKVDNNDVDALNALGYFYVERHTKLDQAYILLNKALKLEPNSYYILDSLGWYYYQVKEFDKAISYLQKAFDIEKDDEVLIHLVSAYWQNQEINRAKSLWKKYHNNFLQNDRVQKLINELELGKVK
ncbi:tetratricopeptide repeat protein [Thiomicrorhabdus sp.]|uniref:tetratricopeptide repeat protein n=1 Tax=Thiomicrorhabdus sp. TaxID=2039724 RepID=UPI002AA8413B|nr:tetratricopeptide repeat protein [Thiomicrorhabdus sp.]